MKDRENLKSILLTIFVFLFSMVFAAFCANAEGKAGWAGNLPAWRPNPDIWWVKILFWIPLLGREVNGFVLFNITFFLMAFLFIPLWGWAHKKVLGFREWGELVCFFVIFSVVEDFLWFVINPDYGLGKFSPSFILWHRHWLWIMPTDYWLGIAAWSIFGIWAKGWKWYLLVTGTVLLLTMITVGIWTF